MAGFDDKLFVVGLLEIGNLYGENVRFIFMSIWIAEKCREMF